MKKYYVYQHTRGSGDVVYVGMGQGVRAWSPKRTDPTHVRWINWHLSQGSTSFCEIVSWYLTKDEAIKEEKQMIAHYEASGCKLFNKQHSKY